MNSIDRWESQILRNRVHYAYSQGVRRGRREAWLRVGAIVWPGVLVGVVLYSLWT